MSKRLAVINNTVERLAEIYDELRVLDTKLTLTNQEERHRVSILAEQSAIRQGISPLEIKWAHLANLKRELGIAEAENIDQLRIQNPAMLSAWRNLLKNDELGRFVAGEGRFKPSPEYRSTDTLGMAAGQNTQSYTELTAGGAFVPQEYDGRLFQSLAQYDEVMDEANCNVVQTLTGRPMTTPSLDDTTSSSPAVMAQAYILQENTLGTQTAIRVGAMQWQDTPKFNSGIIRVSRELFQDAFEPIAVILERIFAQRFALAMGFYAVWGVGAASGQPLGFVNALEANLTPITSASSTLALTDFEAVYQALPQVYRKMAKWYMNDATRNVVTKLLETAGRPMIGPAESLLGKPIVICNSMTPAAAATASIAMLAHPSYLLQRRVAGSEIQTYGQRYAEYGEVGLQAFSRFDCQPMLFNSAFPPAAVLNNK